MQEQTIFNEIIAHQIEGIMFHDDLADMFDFMALKGYKREHEYHALCEFAEMRGMSRYMINHISHLPNTDNIIVSRETPIPQSWKATNVTRYNVTESDRKSKVKELLTKWVEWEKDTKEFYQKKFKELCDEGYIACADKVNKLVKDVDCELKHAERQWLDLSAVGWDMVYICEMQENIHDKYEKLTEDKIKVKMC
jgi:hypothetical protein